MNSPDDEAVRRGLATAPTPRGAAELISPSTQIVDDREEYLGQGRHSGELGRRISEDQIELFVPDDAGEGLAQQLARLAPEFMAVHDVGTSASLRLLGSLAKAAGQQLQRLSIRRQGQGLALAVIRFVEVPNANGQPVRLYATDVNADGPTRQRMTHTLLGYSRLGVLLIGELPPAALAHQLQPVHDAIVRGPWPNRDLLLLPVGPATALAAQAGRLVGHSGVTVRITPQAARLNDAWGFISGAWNRLHGAPAVGGGRREAAATADAPTQPMPLDARPLPPPPRRSMPVPGAMDWSAYVTRCAGIKGVVSCCVFDADTQQPLAHAGELPAADRLAAYGSALLQTLLDTARGLGLGPVPPQAALSFGQQHLLLRPVPGHAGMVLHVVLQTTASNLTLARMQIDRLDV